MKKMYWILLLPALSLLSLAACKKDERAIDTAYNPDLSPSNFTNPTNITNPYLPFAAGKTYVFESQTEGGKERGEITRLPITRIVQGITCIVVNDKVWLNDVLIEDTDDWYAQDNTGNVWYLGEDVDNYNPDGSFKDKHGSWESGVDGAKPGIAMLANPKTGMRYRQEYYFNEAEDEGEVLETGLTVTIPFGSFTNCIKTHDFTALEPDANEQKIYAPGIGLIQEINVTDNEQTLLVEIK